MLQLVPIEALLSGIWFGLSAIFLMLGHHLWKHRLASPMHLSGARFLRRTLVPSLLVGLGGLTLILFLYSAGFLAAPGPDGQETPDVQAAAPEVEGREPPPAAIQTTDSNTGGQKAEAGMTQQTTDPNLFIGIIAVVITLFTGVAMNMVFDLRREWQEEGKRHEAARVELQMDSLRLRQQLEMLVKANELAAGWRREGDDKHGWESMGYRHFIAGR